ncbi:MAG TPA: DNA-binding protein, partial [Bacillota bacterium]|nr:DNA-binding protein [Bacillota bacterium]
MRKLAFITSILFFFIILAACSKDSGESNGERKETADKNEINVRINNDPDFLDPHMAEASITFQMILNMFDGLLYG